MQSGGIRRERVGVCPHCRSPRINTRQQRHRRMLWRCQGCNRVFATPAIGAVSLAEWPNVDLVRPHWIPAMERGARLQQGGGGQAQRGNFGCGCLFIVLIIVGVASFFAIAMNANFPGADTLRTAGQEVSQRLGGGNGTEGAQPPVATPTPTTDPIATPTPTLVATLATRVTSTPAITSTQLPTLVAAVPLAPQPTPTVTPTSTSLPPPDQRHYVYKEYMLELINVERIKAGVPPVTLSDNIAAQLHAENSLANCFSSHWGVDGLKPYMRYSLADGYQHNAENGSGSDYCIKASDRYRALGNIEVEVWEMMEGWMGSPGHRRNILDKWHKKVSIGLAWDKYNMVGYQHFEGDYVEYDQLPQISNGVLSLSGRAINELRFASRGELGLQLLYDPSPHSLTRGQVSRTYCYNSGIMIAAFRYPLTSGWSWNEDAFTTTQSPCPNPYDIPHDAPAPRSPVEARRFWQEAYDASQNSRKQIITGPWITASEWTARGTDFAVTADVSGLLAEYGPGVYTILLWGEMGGEDVPVSEYSIFHEVEPPGAYNPDRWK